MEVVYKNVNYRSRFKVYNLCRELINGIDEER